MIDVDSRFSYMAQQIRKGEVDKALGWFRMTVEQAREEGWHKGYDEREAIG